MAAPSSSFPAPSRHEILGEALRTWGESHPFCLTLLSTVPEPSPEARTGLTIEAGAGKPAVVKGMIRVSVLRIFSHTPEGSQIVGQIHGIQAAEGATGPDLRFYVHDEETIVVREVHDCEQWWLEVLDRHYARGGDPVEVDEGIPP
ncbi:MAG TPA: hypothetical protein VNZ52_09690 [Candidatus Thermoplasmatota archaeon]|nr:hypothetical protein [Candidatus Thermoplasmatota archaeon]